MLYDTICAPSTAAGDGGPGYECDITGDTVVYAKGGGGGGYANARAGIGGSDTANTDGNGGDAARAAFAGTPMTGSGGGGGGRNPYRISGAGASGIVVIRYTVALSPTYQSGAEATKVDGEDLYIYKNTAAPGSLIIDRYVMAHVLAVGGGGAGANPGAAGATQGGAGGGGAGGFYENEMLLLAPGTYSIVVGEGGVNSGTAQGVGADGHDTTIMLGSTAVVTAFGGGGGGIRSVGNNGGSGGGGSKYNSTSSRAGGEAVAGQGYAGGSGDHNRSGAGGGGAGDVGSPTADIDVGGNGGPAKSTTITGVTTYYAAGGGGGSRGHATTASTGGSGGVDGAGNVLGGNGGYGTSSSKTSATAGLANTGSGGGGGCYNQAGGAGGSGIVIIRVKHIMPMKPPASETFAYDGEEHLIYPTDEYDDGSAYTITLAGETVDKISVKSVGTYTYNIALKSGYCWSDGTTDDVVCTVNVTAPTLVINSLKATGWQLGEEVRAPVLDSNPALAAGEYKFLYSTSESGPWSETVPSAVGTYYVTVEVAPSDNYGPPATTPVTEFSIWEWSSAEPSLSYLGYHATLTVTGHTGAALSDFPMLVKFSEDSPAGFSYRYAAADGSDLRFIDSAGNLLSFEIDTWNPDGESYIWVKVPTYENGATVTACWGELEGESLPAAPTPAGVWTSYSGVWHMSEEVDAATAASTAAADSTSNANNAVPMKGTSTATSLAEMVSIEGAVGLGRVNSTSAVTQGNRLRLSKTYKMNGVFTFSGWYRLNGTSVAQQFACNKNTAALSGDGWGLESASGSSTRMFLRGGANTASGGYITGDFMADWVYIAGVYDGTTGTIYTSGVRLGNSFTITQVADTQNPIAFGGNSNSTAYSLNGAYDELRLMPFAAGADWIKAEYDQVRGAVATWGPAKTRPNSVFKNRWLVEPSISKVEWNAGEEGASFTPGEAAYGEAYMVFASPSAAYTNELPTAIGEYSLHGYADAGADTAGTRSWGALDLNLGYVTILAATPYSDLSGGAGGNTVSGRILLANDDPCGGNAAIAVTDQNYDQTDPETHATYWVHDADGVVEGLPFMRNGTIHTLKHSAPIDELCGAEEIWYLENVLIGNTYPANLNMLKAQNFLPWSETAGDQSESSHLAMRDVLNAAICSPCYTNGIGTIYFDAVNGWTSETGEEYRIVVEVATNSTDGASIPTDENVQLITPGYWNETVDEGTGETVRTYVPPTTNRYARADWVAVEMKPYITDPEKGLVALEATKSLPLAISEGGSYSSFYRVVVPLNYRGPARFRIRRETTNPKFAETPDAGGLILIDNVVASYPAMRVDLSSYGVYDEERGGKQILGQEAAWSVPYPSILDSEIYARAIAEFSTNPGHEADIASFVTSAKMYYRWRYLEQKTNDWQVVSLDPANGFKATEPLVLPGRAGDVEYWYELKLNAPYYAYHDYSGAVFAGGPLGLADLYTENISTVTNRSQGVTYQSQGDDWYVRLREGRSSFEGFNLVVRKIDTRGRDSVTNIIEMELVGDHIWRGYLQTADESDNGVYTTATLGYHFEGLNRQEEWTTEWTANTTYMKTSDDFEYVPVSAMMSECGEDEWATIPYDWTTGYMLFQIDDSTRAVTVVHADYQNFNGWSDANKTSKVYTGSYTENESKTGVSPKAVTTFENFSNWSNMPATSDYWRERVVTADLGYNMYENGNYDTPNGWALNQGMFVYSKYKDERYKVGGYPDRAMQLKGQGYGMLDFVNGTESPRGLDTITFSTRLAQFVDFSDFAYYDCSDKMSLSNYTFIARACYDTYSNTRYSGNASVSLIAYYVPGVGCYEFRFEQTLANIDNLSAADSTGTGPNRIGETFSLYRWTYNSRGRLTKELLGSRTNAGVSDMGSIPNTTLSGVNIQNMFPVYLSISNTTDAVCIMAGVGCSGMNASAALSSMNSTDFASICYRDASHLRLTGGTFGSTLANCPGVVSGLYQLPKPIPFASDFTKNNVIDQYKKRRLNFDVNNAYNCKADITGGTHRWYVPAGRLEAFSDNDSQWGLQALTPSQAINIYTAPAGKSTGWSLVATTNLTSFGSSTEAGQTAKFVFHTTDDCSVRIAAAGDEADMRTDVVLDNVTLTQWRGADWEDTDVQYAVPGWQTEVSGLGGHTNFIFSSAWITNRAVLLSAKRTAPGTAASIRAPLYDNSYGRGHGLGMIAFAYHGAQANTKLLVQIATNGVNYGTIHNMNVIDDSYWTTVNTIDFSADGHPPLARGTISTYVGLHGVTGVMRIMVAPETVAAVASETNPARFGEIFIDEVYSRDEPALDDWCWWGWNLRTLGATNSKDEENKMFLADLTTSIDKVGMSLSLNNSVIDDVETTESETYKQHIPFLQTPTFGTNIVGEVSFRARKYDLVETSQPALVTVFGSKTGEENGAWHWLANIIVTNTTYSTYSFKTDQDDNYRAFRLAVIGVPNALVSELSGNTNLPGEDRSGRVIYDYTTPVRVLLDEVVVSEAVRARMAFRHVGTIRNTDYWPSLNRTDTVENVPSEQWQPLCNEDWGIQCELFPAQLPDEIDMDKTPRVRFHWYAATTPEPWGYENWKDLPEARSAWLAPATGTNLIYRSSYLMADSAVVRPETVQPSGMVVQYALEAIWYPKGSDAAATNWLTSADWTLPAWYSPVDHNAGKTSFSAFTILDTVAPHWAWINEVNIFGKYDARYNNSEKDCQFVEIAAPAEASLAGWKVMLVMPDPSGGSVYTNELGRFGTNLGTGLLPSRKNGNIGMASNMVFRVLGSPQSLASGRLNYGDGTLDAVWNYEDSPSYVLSASTGYLQEIENVGIQLVRASGVIEHEIVVKGIDFWNDEGDEGPVSTVAYFNDKLGTKGFFWAGDDDAGEGGSLSVMTGSGAVKAAWDNTIEATPGRINKGQYIDPVHPTANGTSIIIYANLEGGHIRQTFGDAVETNANLIVFYPKGRETGTNITYTVDPWFELGTVTTNGQAAASAPVEGKERVYTVTVGANVSNNVTVSAAAMVKAGLFTESDDVRYREAVVDWLAGGKTLRGDFAYPDSDTPKLADVIGYGEWLNDPATKNVLSQLSLTEMYWLDMDPTVGNLAFVGGVAEPAVEINEKHDLRMGVFALMTNRTDDAASKWYGDNWSPYTLRGTEPGSTSYEYSLQSQAWTSVTFKVTGLILNGQTDPANPDDWTPLRWFAFTKDSFGEDHISRIEIKDPFGYGNPVGYSAGWYSYGRTNAWYRWTIDTKLKPYTVEPMHKENFYEY